MDILRVIKKRTIMTLDVTLPESEREV